MSVSNKWYEEKQRRVKIVGHTTLGWEEGIKMSQVLTAAQNWGEKRTIHVNIWWKSVLDRTNKCKPNSNVYSRFEEKQGSHQTLFTTLPIVSQICWPHYRGSLNICWISSAFQSSGSKGKVVDVAQRSSRKDSWAILKQNKTKK